MFNSDNMMAQAANTSDHVLLVEDSETQAFRIRHLLEQAGYVVDCAARADTALNRLNQTLPALVITDYHLPGVAGDELCRRIRMNVNTRGIPILMLTSDEAEQSEQLGLESGADDYVCKSVADDILLHRIQTLLKKTHAQAIILREDERFTPAAILIVEDSPTYREWIAAELEQAGYRITTAATGMNALEQLALKSFDGVVLDTILPDMSGVDMCRRFVTAARTPDHGFVLLMLTGEENPEEMSAMLAAGADDVVGKSKDLRIIKARLHALLRRKLMYEENQRILSEFQQQEHALLRARAEKVAAEQRAALADQLAHSNRSLSGMFGITEELNKAATSQDVCDRTLIKAMELPGVRAGWISLVENGNFNTAATCNLPPLLMLPGAMDGPCRCRRMLLSGELDSVTNIMQCERLQKPHGDTLGLSYHASVPVWIGEETIGVMNLVGSERGLFREEDLKNLYAVGNQLGIALARTRLVEQIEASHRELESAYRDLKETQAQLIQTAKMASLGELVAGVAHEINNPLAYVSGHLYTVTSGLANLLPEVELHLTGASHAKLKKLRQRLQDMQTGLERIKELVTKLRTFSRLDEGEFKRADIKECIESVLTLLQYRMKDGIKVIRNYGSDNLVDCYPGPLNQVFMNVIANAIDAIKGQGVIRITTNKAVSTYTITIADDGPGIPDAIKDRIFEPFFTTKPVAHGTGLGLSISYGIVKKHGGEIAMESRKGRGTEIIIRIPCKQDGR